MKVAVIGAGSWGTATTSILAENGHEVVIWAREQEIADGINANKRNPLYLPDIDLGQATRSTTDLAEALTGAEAVVMVTPSFAVREMAEKMKPHLAGGVPVVMLSKGVERDTGLLLTEVLTDVFGARAKIAALSGPNHAEEVSRRIPSATVVASRDPEVARLFQTIFSHPMFRVYTSSDVIGVEISAAAKNVIAIISGMIDGLGFGDNSKASIMTRGLAEISRLVAARGGNPMTCMGLAGVGDLIATCTSRHSRNRTFGEMVAKGKTLADFENETHMIAEGATACITVSDLAARYGVEMPIVNVVRGILYEGLSYEEVLALLMSRAPKSEFE